MRLSRARQEHGFTMITVMIATALISTVVVVGASAVDNDLQSTRDDLDRKQAYEAARAGLADYSYHLNRDTNYWTRCTTVPEPSAVNQVNADPLKTRRVPGSTDATYAIELLPRTLPTPASSCNSANPVGTMIEQGGPSTGTFRIRSTGFSNGVERSIVATFKRASFLDYLYFTQLETSDPVTYGDAATIAGANTQCTKFIRDGRYSAAIPGSGGQYCTAIFFIGGDRVNGPLHTNDALQVCSGQPIFGRTTTDVIEVSSPPPGWYASRPPGSTGPWPSCTGSSPNFVGSYVTNAPVLTPPPTNGQLANLAQTGYKFTGQTRITLSGSNMTVTPNGGSPSTIPFPSNGVLYVSNGPCSSAYSPFTAPSIPATSGCGNAIVRATAGYSGQLTIAAENDIIIDDDLIRSGNGMLGLIANNFVRVYHPFSAQTGRGDCNGGSNGSGSQTDLRIDAAILAIQHSFIVDHYDCGASLGTLTVNGAIGQKFRGAVGTFGSSNTGYLKNYTYDDRLRYISPPHFLDPVESAWHIQRQTLDFDG
jgi:Tfp pilus assembly protein PilX